MPPPVRAAAERVRPSKPLHSEEFLARGAPFAKQPVVRFLTDHPTELVFV